ncbi:hypothetical protein [Caballeronia sp. LZ001]|uniref:hypothetical protein n=1 Tax=Caballeronia sp. LZ001 TaxID=3038553 RepID=UPI00285C9476|nr:hypothetical protein [Caballeronia sp. LZ001]MDR5804910.1 hypothetical protein [Caballeronia sp. LZ001]
MYIAYFLERDGYGDPALDQFHDAEQFMELANRRGAETDTWSLDEDAYPLFQRILALHDEQMLEAPAHAIIEAEDELMRFIAGDRPSPLPPRFP